MITGQVTMCKPHPYFVSSSAQAETQYITRLCQTTIQGACYKHAVLIGVANNFFVLLHNNLI